ncbi:hypothetical protein B0J17DRAFT_629969 [Rhizoctonia solani]|nr:hypothetical protein B0J17DRAFT_629969 [Rhizoctonia solani]
MCATLGCLFDYLGISSTFKWNTTYTPPVLPAYAPPVLEPVSGTPSDEQVAKVLGAIHSYQRFADVPTMFDPQLHAGLSQHLFDIQMGMLLEQRLFTRLNILLERYIRRGPTAVSSVPQETTRVGCSGFAPTNEQADVQIHTETNNAGTGADAVRSHGYSRAGEDAGICEAMERSNRLAEHANQLLEQSNLLVERSNRLAERSNQLAEQSSEPSQQPKQPVERSSHHSMDPLKECTGSSNRHIEKSRDPPTTIADASVTSTHHNDFIRAEPALDTPLKRKVETSAARKITTSGAALCLGNAKNVPSMIFARSVELD